MKTKNLAYGLFILAIVLISGCARERIATDNTLPGDSGNTASTETEVYQPTFTINYAGCDKGKFYADLQLDKEYSGTAELRVFDNVQKDKVIATKVQPVTLTAQDNLFIMEHGQALTSNMNYKFCLGGTCQTGYCVVDECLQYSDQSILCNSKAECKHEAFCEAFSCSDKKTKDACDVYSTRCEWFVNYNEKGTDYCRLKACPLHDSKQACDDGYSCQWTGSTCITFNCRSLSNPDVCSQDPRCTWENSQYGAGSCNTK